MTKILIAGIGGVGGYFGGLLARAYEQNTDVQVSFLARGAHLAEIQTNGLTVIDDQEEFVTRPALATDTAADLGVVDYVLLCTKSYDLQPLLEQLRACIEEHTVLVPLMNGVDSKGIIQKWFPANLLADGCVHIAARYVAPGRIAKTGTTAKLFFGIPDEINPRLEELEKLLLHAGIDAMCSTSILNIIWEKYIFISALATATSFYDGSVGFVMEDLTRREAIHQLFTEATSLAVKLGITVPESFPNTLLKRLETIPPDATSSMHSDYIAKKGKTEVESLTGYIVREGQKWSVETKVFREMYVELVKRF